MLHDAQLLQTIDRPERVLFLRWPPSAAGRICRAMEQGHPAHQSRERMRPIAAARKGPTPISQRAREKATARVFPSPRKPRPLRVGKRACPSAGASRAPLQRSLSGPSRTREGVPSTCERTPCERRRRQRPAVQPQQGCVSEAPMRAESQAGTEILETGVLLRQGQALRGTQPRGRLHFAQCQTPKVPHDAGKELPKRWAQSLRRTPAAGKSDRPGHQNPHDLWLQEPWDPQAWHPGQRLPNMQAPLVRAFRS